MNIRIALAFRKVERAAPYERALRDAGLEPIAYTPGSANVLTDTAGLVLTGGTDVDPALYGAARHPESDQPDRERDDYESALIAEALRRDMPLLAICRGMQLLNVAMPGGTLIQHLNPAGHHRQKTGGVPVHDVEAEGLLADILGASRAPVNSRHHQAVDRVGEGLQVVARDPSDGVIEGLIIPGAKFAVAVQWHPEDMSDDARQRRLFAAFAQSLVS